MITYYKATRPDGTDFHTGSIERLLARRAIVGECWEWTGARTSSGGYGELSFNGRPTRVHRIAAALWLGLDLRSRAVVLHVCDNPPCFNPAHLLIGSQADNVRDASRKGRARGPRPHVECQRGHDLSLPRARTTSGRCRICFNAWHRDRYRRAISA